MSFEYCPGCGLEKSYICSIEDGYYRCDECAFEFKVFNRQAASDNCLSSCDTCHHADNLKRIDQYLQLISECNKMARIAPIESKNKFLNLGKELLEKAFDLFIDGLGANDA